MEEKDGETSAKTRRGDDGYGRTDGRGDLRRNGGHWRTDGGHAWRENVPVYNENPSARRGNSGHYDNPDDNFACGDKSRRRHWIVEGEQGGAKETAKRITAVHGLDNPAADDAGDWLFKFRSLNELSKEYEERRKMRSSHFGKANAYTPAPSAANNGAAGDGPLKSLAPSGRTTGTLKKFFPEKGFGFLVGDNCAGDAFMHVSDLRETTADELVGGMKMQYECVMDARSGRPRAKDVTIFGSKTEEPVPVSPEGEEHPSSRQTESSNFVQAEGYSETQEPGSDALCFDPDSFWPEPVQGQDDWVPQSQVLDSADWGPQYFQGSAGLPESSPNREPDWGPQYFQGVVGSPQRSPNRGLELSMAPGVAAQSGATTPISSETTQSGSQSATQSSESADENTWWTVEDAEASAMKLIEEELSRAA